MLVVRLYLLMHSPDYDRRRREHKGGGATPSGFASFLLRCAIGVVGDLFERHAREPLFDKLVLEEGACVSMYVGG